MVPKPTHKQSHIHVQIYGRMQSHMYALASTGFYSVFYIKDLGWLANFASFAFCLKPLTIEQNHLYN